MNKLIICDKNKLLIDKLKEQNLKSNIFEIILLNDDVLNAKLKYINAKICTASNPLFNAGGGLDKLLKNTYPNEWKQAKEFNVTDNLFFIISVDNNINSNREIIRKCFDGLYLNKNNDFILTGIGTAIGGLDIEVFIEELKYFMEFNNGK